MITYFAIVNATVTELNPAPAYSKAKTNIGVELMCPRCLCFCSCMQSKKLFSD